jgi:hypothetical protein
VAKEVEAKKEEPAKAPEPEAKPVEAKPKEEAKDERDTTIEALQKQVIELTNRVMAVPVEKAPEPAKPIEAAKPPEKVEVATEDFFENQEEYDKAFEDKKVMGKVLARVKSAGAQEAMRAIPSIVNNVIKQSVPIILKTEKFFDDNKDLADSDKRKFVGYVANDLSGKNPDWNLDKLFTELGKEVRSRLGLKDVAQQKVTATGLKPAFARGSGGRKPTEVQPDLSSMESQILDILPEGEIRRMK